MSVSGISFFDGNVLRRENKHCVTLRAKNVNLDVKLLDDYIKKRAKCFDCRTLNVCASPFILSVLHTVDLFSVFVSSEVMARNIAETVNKINTLQVRINHTGRHRNPLKTRNRNNETAHYFL